MLIYLSFPPSVIISVLHLLKRGMERRGKKLLGPRAVAAISDIEEVLAAIVALPKRLATCGQAMATARAREEGGAGIGVEGKRERERSYCGPEDKRKNK